MPNSNHEFEERHPSRRAEDEPSTRWTLQNVLAVMAVLGFVAQMGMNWQIIQSLREAQARTDKFISETLPTQYISREVFEIRTQAIAKSLDQLTQALRDDKQDKNADQPRKYNSRQFDK